MDRTWEVVIDGDYLYVRRYWIQQRQPSETYEQAPYAGWGTTCHVVASGFNTEAAADEWAAEHIVARADYGEMVI